VNFAWEWLGESAFRCRLPFPVVVFCGNLVEESGDPCIEFNSDLKAWPATLARILPAGGEHAVYVPGHGSVVGATFVRQQQDWLHHRL
jgi:glyoxylase-like metal-dependent hydrolase (beta-lactamase superfamily II)